MKVEDEARGNRAEFKGLYIDIEKQRISQNLQPKETVNLTWHLLSNLTANMCVELRVLEEEDDKGDEEEMMKLGAVGGFLVLS
ncbi:hypothetical protein RJT34_23755 [Clitoria ternatea]|uniref:Uncharacterized protein n=1 Tax=Clitoria ternatea TaxID=43366 RepID=A0AAN9FN83_CLITE